MAHIVFDVARVDRLDTVVPYLIYDEKVQPYWKPLVLLPAVRNGCQALEMTVVFQPKRASYCRTLRQWSHQHVFRKVQE